MSVYLLPSIFSAMMIICGLLAWKSPLSWEKRDSKRWPHYNGKIAHNSADIWDIAQVIFGKTQFAFGVIHIFMEIPEVLLLKYILQSWPNDDATIPVIMCLAVPGIVMIIAGTIVTTMRLKRSR